MGTKYNKKFTNEDILKLVELSKDDSLTLKDIYNYFECKYEIHTIRYNANKIGIKFYSGNGFKSSDAEKMKQLFESGANVTEIFNFFNGQYKRESILHFARKHSLNKKNTWTEKDVKILLKACNESKDEDYLLKLFPDKTIEQIRRKARKLGVVFERGIVYDPNNLVECLLCHKRLLFKDNFYKRDNEKILSHTCKECIFKRNRINHYKKDYGIELDWDSFFDTFDVTQWYRWTVLEKTPNGKYLSQLPKNLVTKENIGIIARYVIEDILHLNNDELDLFSQEDMKKLKIGFSSNKHVRNSPIYLLKLAYPGYIPKNKFVSYDGTIMYSKDEVRLYNFIHNVLGIKELKYTGMSKKNKITTDDGVSYIPDFIIKNDRLNVVIEYFGLYKDIPVDINNININVLQSYKLKTINKIDFYNSIEEITFIDIYPNDLKHGFKGVVGKLSFLINKEGGEM